MDTATTQAGGLNRAPLPFQPSHEAAGKNQAKAEAAIRRTLRRIQETTWQDYGHATRSVHAKSHALLEGELQVLDHLPEALAQGIFARPATYPVVLRFSTTPGDILDDAISAPRAVAVKIIGVEGERLPGSEADRTQDFLMANGPAFGAPDAAGFEKSLQLVAPTTDTGQTWKKLLSTALRAVVGLGAKSPALRALGGQPWTHPLGETYYTQTPFRYGNYTAKLSLVPTDPVLTGLHQQPVPLSGRPNGLRAAMIEHFRIHGGTWALRVQLRNNAHTMPLDDASVPWPESESPYRPVARLTVPPQPAWSEGRAREADDGLAFSPWHGITAHLPLGSVNQARRDTYAASARFRAEHNRCPIHEPHERLTLSNGLPQLYGRTPGREGRRPHTPDARPGSWTQPLAAPARQVAAGAIAGGLAGVLLSVAWLGIEAATGETAEVVRLQRASLKRSGYRARRETAPPSPLEQMTAHGGHVVLSAMAGGAYGMVAPRRAPPLLAGAGFGAGFYFLAYGMLAPILGLRPPPWSDRPATTAQRGFFHVLFGVVTAELLPSIAKRL